MKTFGLFLCLACLCFSSFAETPAATFFDAPIHIGECISGISVTITNSLKLAKQFYLGELGNDIISLFYYILMGPVLIITDYEGSRD